MKPFDKETYERLVKEGKTPKIVTRAGDNVTIYLTNFPGRYPIVAKVEDVEEPETFRFDGVYNEDDDTDNIMDLFFADSESDAKYRPFKNDDEFLCEAVKHDYWMRRSDGAVVFPNVILPNGVLGYDYKSAFKEFVWRDDDTPCGKRKKQ